MYICITATFFPTADRIIGKEEARKQGSSPSAATAHAACSFPAGLGFSSSRGTREDVRLPPKQVEVPCFSSRKAWHSCSSLLLRPVRSLLCLFCPIPLLSLPSDSATSPLPRKKKKILSTTKLLFFFPSSPIFAL